MEKTSNVGRFCRVCMNELNSRSSPVPVLERPKPAIELTNSRLAQSYLQCYYFFLHKDYSVGLEESMSDYCYICGACRERLRKATQFLMSCITNEEFLLSTCQRSSSDEDDDDDAGYVMKDGSNAAEGEDLMIEEHLDPSGDENEPTATAGESEYDAFEVEPATEPLPAKSNPHPSELQNDIEEFEEVILEVPKGNCELEQTLPDADISQQVEGSLQKYLYFNCELCTKIFNDERNLYEHQYREHDQKSLGFPCDKCQRRHVSMKALRFHRREAHKNVKYMDCEVCGKLVLSMHYEIHKKQHTHICDTCDLSFNTVFELRHHQTAQHETARDKRHNCTECKRFFFSSETFKLHMMTHNSNINCGAKAEYACYICTKTFSRPINLKQHIQRHNGNVLKCPHCVKTFTRVREFEIHIRYHSKDAVYKCDQCQKAFVANNNLQRHMNRFHPKARGPKCEVCHKIFKHSFGLKQHLYRHEGWPFPCDLCDKGFSTEIKLKEHFEANHEQELKPLSDNNLQRNCRKRT